MFNTPRCNHSFNIHTYDNSFNIRIYDHSSNIRTNDHYFKICTYEQSFNICSYDHSVNNHTCNHSFDTYDRSFNIRTYPYYQCRILINPRSIQSHLVIPWVMHIHIQHIRHCINQTNELRGVGQQITVSMCRTSLYHEI